MKAYDLKMVRIGKLFAILALGVFSLVVPTGKAWAAPTYIDETSAQFSSTGTWTTISSHSEAYPTPGSFKESGIGAVTATWSMPATLATGNYEVWANWRTLSTYGTCVQFDVTHAAGTTSKKVNQSTPDTPPYFGAGNRSSDNFLGVFTLNSSSRVKLTHTASAGNLASADAIMLVPTTETAPVTLDISDLPLASQIQSAPPNLMFLLDDSGSMDWEFLTPEADGIFASEYYVFDNPGDNVYSSTYILTGTDRAKFKAQWSGYNRLYYNPKTTYTPWPSLGNASTTTPRSHPMSAAYTINLDATYYAISSDIVLDNKDAAAYAQSGTVKESSASYEYLSSSYYLDVTGQWATWTTPANLAGDHEVWVWWTISGTRDNNAKYEIFDGAGLKNTVFKNQTVNGGQWISLGTYTFAGTAKGSVKLTRSGNGSSTSADAVKFVPAASASINILNAHYYTWDDVNSNGVRDAGESIWLVNLTDPIAYYRFNDANANDRVESGELIVTAAASVPATVRTTALPTSASAYTTERQSFANWYSFYRRRELTATAAISRVISGITQMRVGIKSINNKIHQPVVDVHVGASDQTATLYSTLYALNITAMGTPLRLGLKSVGQYYDVDDGQDGGIGASPIATEINGGACQQNFCIMMTDGYYNGNSPAVGNVDGNNGAPFADGYSDTLSDVAMYYYENDLANNLVNKVKEISAYDNATWQHMSTYSVAFGVTGTLNPDSYPESNNFKNAAGAYPVWPNPTAGSLQKIDDLWHASVNGRGSFLSAGDPQELVDALTAVVQNISSKAGSESSLTLNSDGLSGDLQVGSRLYETTYNPGDWSGDVKAYSVDYITGVPQLPALWSTRQLLEDFLDSASTAHTTRIIATYDGSRALGSRGIPFKYAYLTATQQALMHSDSTAVDYLRGDSSLEVQKGGSFRDRVWHLGDIVNSMAVYNDDVLYVGANDGMLHAFSATSGEELFAYVPNLVLGNMYNLTQTTYTHNFFVNASPTVRRVGTSTTYLFGGLGKGGKGYYCLDISPAKTATFQDLSASQVAKETQLNSMVKWEYSGACPTLDNDLGYTFSDADMLRSNATSVNSGLPVAGYVLFFGNGYSSPNGSAVLYCLNPETGAVIKKIDTQSGPGNGLTTPVVFDGNGDFRVDYAYAGDLKGNLWKFDLSSADPANWDVAYKIGGVPEPVFRTQSPGQPITSRPEVMYAPNNENTGEANPGYMVIFGTGKYLGVSDISDTSQQSVYGIWDYGDDADNAEFLGRFAPGAAQKLSNQPVGYTLLEQTDIYESETVVANFSAIPPTTTDAATVTFEDHSSGTITSRLWDFGDTTTSTATSPDHTFTVPGIYDVSLTVTRTTPTPVVSSAKVATITVKHDMVGVIATDLHDNPELPDASTVLAYFESAVSTATTSGVTVQFSNLSQGLVTNPAYLWDFGDGDTSTLAAPAHTYTAIGDYTVTLIVSSDEGGDTRTNSNYISISHPWVVAIDQNEGTGATTWSDVRVFSNNVAHYCTEADATTGQHKNPGPCPDDPDTVSINENDPAVYPVHLGWYFNLPTPRERVVVNADIGGGVAWIISHIPQETMCSAEGYSWVMALDAASGGRTDASIFDINYDRRINSEDLIQIGTEWVSITGFKVDKRVYMPGRLYDVKTKTENIYFEVGTDGGDGTGTPPIVGKAPRQGVVLWQEMN
ncbi:PilC/PilY family type IV pilus protein [Thiovibrio frasassiensis]|uniref:PilC/PilY family type IV pilus protein n=1 Tax=Thiovibrio frasassiensis TaxID=2984131 RepID=A0A9X4RL59_9BACT|nr:PilC/PilY family type IV pilus protein [Thiovibrio frasassiensis]MDG4475731.1 PilC/PilY family type IV pilus protein [Thiovibrio frasassiensis]